MSVYGLAYLHGGSIAQAAEFALGQKDKTETCKELYLANFV